MMTSILATKLYIPPPRAKRVARPRLLERLNAGLQASLTLISAPAGFGKSSLLSEWAANNPRPLAWLSLDEGDNEPNRFLAYLISAVRRIHPDIGEALLAQLQSPQSPSIESILTSLLNELSDTEIPSVLILDDYHLIDNQVLDNALAFLIERMPPQMRLVIATREDPRLPLARMRGRGQLNELRVSDLRFTLEEATGFFNQVMGLKLSQDDIAALEARTEGWIAGLQLAAISMQGQDDNHKFIESFTGSHHFVLDYLLEEVLQQQSETLQNFLLQTAILERVCGSLADAVLLESSGQAHLEALERANLFTISLDKERRWYRYHQLFADLLRQRLQQSMDKSAIAELHLRASQWYEANGMELEAFHHAGLSGDIERCESLIEGKGMPLHFRGGTLAVLKWLESLPKAVLDARPALWVIFSSVSLAAGRSSSFEQKLQAAEASLKNAEDNEKNRDMRGQIAAIRATAAVSRHDVETIISQSEIALELLHPQNLAFRTSTLWKLGYAYYFRGERAAARTAYNEVIEIGQASRNLMFAGMAMMGLGTLEVGENRLQSAVEIFQKSLELFGGAPLPMTAEARLGLGKIYYEWNDFSTARKYALESFQLVQQYEQTDRPIACELFLAHLQLAEGNFEGLPALLSRLRQIVEQKNYVQQMPELAMLQVLVLLQEGNLKAAAHFAENAKVPVLQARVALAEGEAVKALAILEALRQEAEHKNWADKRLKAMVLQTLALSQTGEKAQALDLLADVLEMAEAGGFMRLFLDEGKPMLQLLSEMATQGKPSDYLLRLLAAFEDEESKSQKQGQTLIDTLSERELEILDLIARGFSNQDISEMLFLALSTVKGHNQNIFSKLQVQRRTEAVARARELGLI